MADFCCDLRFGNVRNESDSVVPFSNHPPVEINTGRHHQDFAMQAQNFAIVLHLPLADIAFALALDTGSIKLES